VWSARTVFTVERRPLPRPYLPLLPNRRASPPFGWYSLRLPTQGWPGWVDVGDWLYTDIGFQRRSPIPVLTGRRVTLLIETNVLPLSQTAPLAQAHAQMMQGDVATRRRWLILQRGNYNLGAVHYSCRRHFVSSTIYWRAPTISAAPVANTTSSSSASTASLFSMSVRARPIDPTLSLFLPSQQVPGDGALPLQKACGTRTFRSDVDPQFH